MSARTPLYPRLLRLRHVHPNGWQRALLGEGALAIAAVLVLADVATAWTLLVLPLAVAAVVKGHDVLAGTLQRRPGASADAGALSERVAEPVLPEAAGDGVTAPDVVAADDGGVVRPARRRAFGRRRSAEPVSGDRESV